MSAADDERAAKGRRAQQQYRELEQAFDKTAQAIVTRLAQTPPEKPETVLKLHLALQNLAAVRKALMEMAQDGAIAEVALARAGLAG
jgi:hypothetical protein